MLVRRTGAAIGVALALALSPAGPSAWADEPVTTDPECTSYLPPEEVPGDEGTAEPAPSSGTGSEEPAPEPSAPAEEPPTDEEPAEEPTPDDPVVEPEPSGEPVGEDPTVCAYAEAGPQPEVFTPPAEAVQSDTGATGAGAGEAAVGDHLPRTGAPSLDLLALGLGLVLLGGGTVVAGTRRSR